MNKKLITLAVSGALAAPMIAQAEDSGPNLYGRLNVGLAYQDTNIGDLSADGTDVRDVSSRFGIRGEEELGNGLAAVYRYEFRVRGDRGQIRSDPEQRLSYVGLKGGFGQISLGSQWGAFYNMVGTHIDPTYTLGYFGYSSYAGGDYRIRDSIQYSGSFGPVAFQADFQLDGDNPADDDIDRIEVGASYTAGPITAAVALDKAELVTELDDGTIVSANQDRDILGAALKYSGDGFGVGLGYMDNDNGRELASIFTNIGIGDSTNLHLQYWDGSGNNDDVDANGVVLGLYHALSSRTKLWTEATKVDAKDNATGIDGDTTLFVFGVRHDF